MSSNVQCESECKLLYLINHATSCWGLKCGGLTLYSSWMKTGSGFRWLEVFGTVWVLVFEWIVGVNKLGFPEGGLGRVTGAGSEGSFIVPSFLFFAFFFVSFLPLLTFTFFVLALLFFTLFAFLSLLLFTQVLFLFSQVFLFLNVLLLFISLGFLGLGGVALLLSCALGWRAHCSLLIGTERKLVDWPGT